MNNTNHKTHKYRVTNVRNYYCTMKININSEKYEDTYKGSYPITKVWKNGTVNIRQGAVQ